MTSQWHIDRIIEQIEQERFDHNRYLHTSKEEMRRQKRRARTPAANTHFTTQISALEERLEESDRLFEGDLDLVRSVHPILLGPSSVDAILASEPSTEFVRNGQVPFDDMFFEFLEPLVCDGPHGQHQLAGISFTLMDGAGDGFDFSYQAEAFYVRPGGYARMKIPIGVSQNRLNPMVGLAPVYQDWPSQKITVYNHEDGTLMGATYGLLSPYTKSGLMEHKQVSRDELARMHMSTDNLATLSIGIINFINAQHVTVVEHRVTRKNQRVLIHGKSKFRDIAKVYRIVGIETCERNRSDKPSGGSLHVRHFRRGHVRRLYDRSGGEATLRDTTWVNPCIVGPDGAPWQDQRHAVLAGLLEKEQAMIRDYKARDGVTYRVRSR